MATPATQSAWFQVARGKPSDVLKFSKQTPVPKPGPGEVLVKVHYAALNPAGYKVMTMIPSFMRKLPGVPENDLSGTVVDASDSTRFHVGDAVFWPRSCAGRTQMWERCSLPYAVIKDKHLVLKPDALSFEEAAGIPVAGGTAHEALTTKGNLKAGERVFINGGGSSVGRFAIQIAKNLGAYVVVSCSAASQETCLALGADETVDYTTSPLEAQLVKLYPLSKNLGFNLLFDTIGSQPLYASSALYLLPSPSRYITIEIDQSRGMLRSLSALLQNTLRPSFLGGVPRRWTFLFIDIQTQYLEDFRTWAKEGKLTCSVDSIHEWDEEGVRAAYSRIATQKARGKVVVRIGA